MTSPPLPTYPGFSVESQETVYEGRYNLEVVTFRHERFDGTASGLRRWEIFRRGRAAAMLPYDPWADQVVLLEQFRVPALAAGVDPIMLEVPAGFLNPAETAEMAARREMREEIGLEADMSIAMLDVMLTPGGSDERCTLFAGRVHAPPSDRDGVGGSGGLASEQEDIRVRVYPAEHAIEQAANGFYSNSVTALALLWLGMRRPQLRAQWL